MSLSFNDSLLHFAVKCKFCQQTFIITLHCLLRNILLSIFLLSTSVIIFICLYFLNDVFTVFNFFMYENFLILFPSQITYHGECFSMLEVCIDERSLLKDLQRCFIYIYLNLYQIFYVYDEFGMCVTVLEV